MIGGRWAGLTADRADQLGGFRIGELGAALAGARRGGARLPRRPRRWRDSGMAGTQPVSRQSGSPSRGRTRSTRCSTSSRRCARTSWSAMTPTGIRPPLITVRARGHHGRRGSLPVGRAVAGAEVLLGGDRQVRPHRRRSPNWMRRPAAGLGRCPATPWASTTTGSPPGSMPATGWPPRSRPLRAHATQVTVRGPPAGPVRCRTTWPSRSWVSSTMCWPPGGWASVGRTVRIRSAGRSGHLNADSDRRAAPAARRCSGSVSWCSTAGPRTVRVWDFDRRTELR